MRSMEDGGEVLRIRELVRSGGGSVGSYSLAEVMGPEQDRSSETRRRQQVGEKRSCPICRGPIADFNPHKHCLICIAKAQQKR